MNPTTDTQEAAGRPNPQNTRRIDIAACVLLLLLTIFRVWYAGTLELLQDEAYYWQWSRHLDWGYYDNTPLLALVIRVFTSLLGTNEMAVRMGAVVSGLAVSAFVYSIAKKLFDAQIAFASILLLNIIPEYAGGAVIATQDPIQLGFWAASVYTLMRARDGGWSWWILAGILTGITAMAKLNGLWLLPATLLYLAVSPPQRHWLKKPQPYIAAVLAAIVFSPFVWWNHTHQNAFWTHIGVMGSRSHENDGLKWFFRFLGDQALLLSPLLLLTLFRSLLAGWMEGRRKQNDALLFVWAPTITVFMLTALVSLRSKVEGNWPAAAYITGAILLGIALTRLWQSRSIGSRAWVIASCALSMLITSFALFPQPFYAMGAAALFKKHPESDRLNEFHGWRTMAARVQTERDAMGTNPFIFGINYRMPSEAAFYLPDHPQTYSLFLHDRANEYMFWENQKDLIGRDAILIHDAPTTDHIDDARAVFESVEVMPPLKITRPEVYGSAPVRTIQIYRCHNFKGYDVKLWQKGW